MIIMTSKGLYCPRGDFYIDPSRGVERAVITHAHSDHARRGSKQYYAADCGISVLKSRLGQNISVLGFKYGEPFEINGVKISFHSAGHILGSAQVRVQLGSEVWVASGDYKREYDPTCAPFEPVKCDVFITEATFGTPGYTWPKGKDLGREIYDWWQTNAADGINSVLFAYSLGKAQRVLGVLEPYATEPIYCHPATTELTECYRHEGVELAETICLSTLNESTFLEGALILTPSSFLKNEKNLKTLGGEKNFRTAFASGWMAKGGFGYNNYDHGFVMSDHADWNDLLLTIEQTGAKRVYVQHRDGALVRHLRAQGIMAFSDQDMFPANPEQLELFL
jgi:putative mRNA 3-end processing factor